MAVQARHALQPEGVTLTVSLVIFLVLSQGVQTFRSLAIVGAGHAGGLAVHRVHRAAPGLCPARLRPSSRGDLGGDGPDRSGLPDHRAVPGRKRPRRSALRARGSARHDLHRPAGALPGDHAGPQRAGDGRQHDGGLRLRPVRAAPIRAPPAARRVDPGDGGGGGHLHQVARGPARLHRRAGGLPPAPPGQDGRAARLAGRDPDPHPGRTQRRRGGRVERPAPRALVSRHPDGPREPSGRRGHVPVRRAPAPHRPQLDHAGARGDRGAGSASSGPRSCTWPSR